MADCGKCLHEEVCATAKACDGRVPKCKHFLQKGTLIPVTCKLGEKGCYGDGKCRYKKDCENKVITHADQIRAMTDEQMAKFLMEVEQGNFTIDICDDRYCTPEDEKCPHNCTNAAIKWLQSPTEEGTP